MSAIGDTLSAARIGTQVGLGARAVGAAAARAVQKPVTPTAAPRADSFERAEGGRFLRLVQGGKGSPAEQIRAAHDPREARRIADGLSPVERQQLIQSNPRLVGSTDGLPPEMRYAANRILIGQARDQAVASGDTAKAKLYGDLLADPNRQFIVFDPRGDGRIAEVHGNLDRADNVAVVVPGITNTQDNFQALSDDAKRLQAEAELRAPNADTAVVAWLGYDTPEIADAPFNNKAEVGGPALKSFVDGLLLPEQINTSVVAHSYGSVVAGQALKDGLNVDNVAVIGSPGMQVNRLSDFHLEPGTGFFAGRAPGDYVSWSQNFGTDPSDPRFGATRFETGSGDGGQVRFHSNYFGAGSESLRNLAFIATGQRELVSVHQPSLVERGAVAADELHRNLFRRPLDFVQGIAGGAEGLVRRVEDFVQDQVNLGPLDRPVDAFLDGVQNFRRDALEGVSRFVDVAQRLGSPDLWHDVASDVWSTGAIQDAAGKVKNFVADKADQAKDFVVEKADQAKDFVVEKADQAKDLAVDTYEKGKDIAVETFEKGKDIAGAAVDKGKDLVDGALDKGKKVLDKLTPW